jgi:polyisoprenoid-binding protein YceI
MKKLILFLLLISTHFSYSQAQLNVVTGDSKVTWTGTKVVGFHQGIIKIKSGFVKIKEQKLIGGEFIIDMNSITCTDIPDSDPIPKRKLENHLKSEAFFDVAKFPTASFKITEVRVHPDNPVKYLLLGDLTIKGITKRWKIEVEPSTQTEKLFIAQAEIRFDRQQFGVAYKGIKDELVHDIVRLNVILKAR